MPTEEDVRVDRRTRAGVRRLDLAGDPAREVASCPHVRWKEYGRVGVRTLPCRGWALFAAALLGCGGGSPEADPLDDLPSVSVEERAVLGGAGATGAEALGGVAAVVVLSRPTAVVVADELSEELHAFEPDGAHLWTTGRVGGGPGEHRAVGALAARRDGGFCTWDRQMVRATSFDAAGEALEVVRFDLGELDVRPTFEGFFSDCGFVLRDVPHVMDMQDQPTGLRRDTARILLYGSTASRLGTLPARVQPPRWFRNEDGVWGQYPLLFGAELFAVPTGEEVWVGASGSLRWDRYGPRGEGRGTVSIPVPERPIPDGAVEDERARRIREAERSMEALRARPEVAEMLRKGRVEALLGVPARASLPAYDRALPAPGPGLWVRRTPLPDARPVVWILVGPDGARARLTLDRDEELRAASNELLVLASTDTLDAPVLRIVAWSVAGDVAEDAP